MTFSINPMQEVGMRLHVKDVLDSVLARKYS